MALPRYVVFDLDHTLVRSAGFAPALRQATREFGYDAERAVCEWRATAGMPLHHQLARAGVHDKDVDAVTARVWELVGDGDPAPIAGADEFLRRLRDAGAMLYLSTGCHPSIAEKLLTAAGWRELFAAVHGTSREYEKGPAHYRHIVAHAGVGAAAFGSQAATIGDGASDMRYGAAEGVALRIGLDEDGGREAQLREAGATHVVSSLADASALLFG